MLVSSYDWVLDQPGPKMILEALKIFGTHEVPGPLDNPVILQWATEIGVQADYKHDITPWCGLTMGVVAKRAGKEIPHAPLWALNWVTFGVRSPDGAKFGDILVFMRAKGGHVALCIGEDATCFHILGGNELDSVTIIRYPKDRLVTVRRPVYKIQPINVCRRILNEDGSLAA